MAKPKVILVVDDDPNLVMFFKDFFKQEGYNSICTDDPEKAGRTADLVHPDLLIIDIRMPKIDGFGVLAKVREKTPEIKTIVISAFVDTVQEKIKEAKVQAVLKKPVQFEELEQWILKLLAIPKEELTEKIPAGARPEIRVLFVDDEDEITDWVAEFFNQYGFKTDIANSGEEGLEKMKTGQYDLLISDNSMREMSGLEMIKKIRTEVPRKPHSVAVCSANLDSELREQYARIGVAQFFSKPVGLEEIIQWMESQIPQIEKKRQAL
jgi:DNA-binding response OmpR family regulator